MVRSALAEVVGKRVQALRKERRWSQRVLAAKLGMDSSKLSKYETGEHLPPPLTLVQMADAFDISLDMLMGRGTADAPPLGDDLAKRLRLVEKLGPKEKEAAAGMIDMLLGMHGILAKRPRSAGKGRLPAGESRDVRLARLFGEIADLEKGYRDVAASVLEGVLRLLRYVRDPETPRMEG